MFADHHVSTFRVEHTTHGIDLTRQSGATAGASERGKLGELFHKNKRGQSGQRLGKAYAVSLAYAGESVRPRCGCTIEGGCL